MEEASRMKEERSKSPEFSKPPPYLEVFCRTSGKFRRFAAGTTAGFAVYVINSKLEHGDAPALLIESVKEDEEPVTFGSNAILVNYGNGWKLQTITKEDDRAKRLLQTSELYPKIEKTPNFPSFNGPKNRNQPNSALEHDTNQWSYFHSLINKPHVTNEMDRILCRYSLVTGRSGFDLSYILDDENEDC